MRSQSPAHLAAAFDRTDPFTFSRVQSHLRNGVGLEHNFERARRMPAPVQDRFKLTNKKDTHVNG